MWPFRCKHPAQRLAVAKDSTDKIADADFRHITHHLVCRDCGELVDIKYAKMRGGSEGMRSRARDRMRLAEIARPIS